MESLDDEVMEMKMSLVKQNRAAALCRFCPPVQPLSIFFFPLGLYIVKLLFTRQHISKSFLGILL